MPDKTICRIKVVVAGVAIGSSCSAVKSLGMVPSTESFWVSFFVPPIILSKLNRQHTWKQY